MREIIQIFLIGAILAAGVAVCTQSGEAKQAEIEVMPAESIEPVQVMAKYAKIESQTLADGYSRGAGGNLSADAGEFQETAPARPEIVHIDNGTPPIKNEIVVVSDPAINLGAEGNGEFAMPL